MPYKDFSIADFNQTSYFKSWARNNCGSLTRGYTTPSENTQAKGVTISGIPAGATITAYNVYFNVDTGLYGGTHTPASGASVNPSDISFYWKSNTGGSYPSYPTSNTGDSTNYQDKTGLLTRTGIYVRVTYTESGAPPPATGFSLSSTSIDAGQALTAYISPVSDYQYSIVYSYYGGAPFYIVPYLGPGTYYDVFNIPMSFVNSIPNATRALCTAELTTVSADGTVQISKKSIDFYINVPASVVPTLTGLTAALVSNGVDASITRYVQNYSKCLLEITGAAGAYDSTISSYKITGGGFTVNAASGTVGTFGTSGELTFTATITDSRGRTATATVTITVDAYNTPRLTDISAFRCDVNGAIDRAGAYVLLKATPAISPIGGQNSAALAGRVYMKGGTPGTPESMTSNTASILGSGLLLPVKTYMAEIIVQDLINTYAYTATIPTDVVGLHILDKALGGGIGKYGETPGMMEVAWPLSAPSLYGHSNILHNPDFRNPLNQRGVSGAISTGTYFYDRWLRNNGTVTTNADYLTIGASAEIEQRIEGDLLAGETVTVAVMVGGTVFSGTGIMPTSAGAVSVTVTGWGTATLGYATGYMYVRLAPTAASNVVRVKLEFGTVSTLAYDSPTDYGTELLTCKRYFQRLKAAGIYGTYPGIGFTATSNTMSYNAYLPVPLRIVPTVTFSGTLGLYAGQDTGARVTAMATSSSSYNGINEHSTGINVTHSSSLNLNQVYRLINVNNANGYIDLSADL